MRLALRDFGDVVAQLLVGLARVARTALRLDHRQDFPAGRIQTVVGDRVPGRGVIAIDGNFEAHLRPVLEIPSSAAQCGVDEDVAGLTLAERRSGLIPGTDHVGILAACRASRANSNGSSREIMVRMKYL